MLRIATVHIGKNRGADSWLIDKAFGPRGGRLRVKATAVIRSCPALLYEIRRKPGTGNVVGVLHFRTDTGEASWWPLSEHPAWSLRTVKTGGE